MVFRRSYLLAAEILADTGGDLFAIRRAAHDHRLPANDAPRSKHALTVGLEGLAVDDQAASGRLETPGRQLLTGNRAAGEENHVKRAAQLIQRLPIMDAAVRSQLHT